MPDGPPASLVDALPAPAAPQAATLTLHLVRHGRTRFNAEGLLQGWSDSELTPDGLEGVRTTAQALAALDLAGAYASPLGRTVTTAREILRHHPGTELVTDDRLKEFSFGDLEERPEPELSAVVDPYAMFREVFDGTFPGLPGGEPGSVYLSRVARAFTAIEAAHPGGGDVVVVSHGVTLMAYLTMVGAWPRRPLANASVSTVEILPGGVRTVTGVGLDPSGRTPAEPEIPLQAAAVALEEAAAWHPEG